MKKIHVLFLILFAAAIPLSAAIRCEDFQQAGKRQGKGNLVVLLYGSDWCNDGENFRKNVWDRDELTAALDGSFVLLGIDRPERTERVPQGIRDKNKQFKADSRNYPAVLAVDSDGRIFARIDGIDPKIKIAEFVARLKEMAKARTERDKLWAQAASSGGEKKAELLGKGLDIMGLGIGEYRHILNQIKEADPKDNVGYARKYEFHNHGLMGKVLDMCKNNQHAEAEKFIDDYLSCRQLTTPQKQELWAMKFAIYSRWKEKQDKKLDCLRKMVELGPELDMGIGAKNYLDYFEGPVSLKFGWKNRHCKQGPTEWIIEADDCFDRAGDYEITMHPGRVKNALTVNKLEIFADGKQIVSINEQRTVHKQAESFRFKIPADLKGKKAIIKIFCRTEDGTDSNGRITVRKVLNLE